MKFVIKKSVIAGFGMFANSKIEKGELILILSGEICSLEEIIFRINSGQVSPSDPLQVDAETYIVLDSTSRTLNHSCNPNAYISKKNELVAIKEINFGDEITFDYSTTMNDSQKITTVFGRELWTCKCNCLSVNCRKVIDQFKTIPLNQRTFYIQNRYLPDFIYEEFQNK